MEITFDGHSGYKTFTGYFYSPIVDFKIPSHQPEKGHKKTGAAIAGLS
jgi:hypothetical protein